MEYQHGFLIDRLGPSRMLLVGLLLAGIAFLGYGWMHALWVYYLFYFLQTAGYVVAGPIPNQVLISNWFNRFRGRAMGMALPGSGNRRRRCPDPGSDYLIENVRLAMGDAVDRRPCSCSF